MRWIIERVNLFDISKTNRENPIREREIFKFIRGFTLHHCLS